MLNMIFNKQMNDKRKNNMTSIYTAFLSMAICMVCLAGTSWAWFTASQRIPAGTLQASETVIDTIEVYQLMAYEEELIEIATNSKARKRSLATDSDVRTRKTKVPISQSDDGCEYEFQAKANIRYRVYVSMTGNAETKFLKVETGDGDFFTTLEKCEFTLFLSKDSPVIIYASWGTETKNVVEFSDKSELGFGEIPACDCDVLCTENRINEDCKVCAERHRECMGEKPKCICEVKCQEGTTNGECPVCSEEPETCCGKEDISQTQTASDSNATPDTQLATDSNSIKMVQPESAGVNTSIIIEEKVNIVTPEGSDSSPQ